MVKRNKKKFKNKVLFKNYIIGILFLIFWILALFIDEKTLFWYFSFKLFNFLFWFYYQYIFIPIIFLLRIFLFFTKNFAFNFYFFIWIFIYFLSLSSIFWFFNEDYSSFFNFFWLFKTLFWVNASIFLLILLFFVSIYLIFWISYINFLKKIFSFLLNSDFFKRNSLEEISYDTSSFTKKLLEENKILKKENEKLKGELELLKINKETLEKKQEDEKKDIKIVVKKTWFLKNLSNLTSWIKNNLEDEENNKEKENYIVNDGISKKIKINKNAIKDKFTFDWWKLPDVKLLKNVLSDTSINENDIREKQIEIIDKLKQFKINVKITWYVVWPTVIQFRLKPNEWVKLNKIENLKKDLSLALHAKSIRIQAPIPWEWVVWIEIPNPQRQIVALRELIESQNFNDPKIDIPLCIWKDVNGNLIVWDLTKMPHLLVAWQTASWKSVWINWFIVSLLYKFSPSELKMIMIDPKMVELSIYNGIPHLLSPVITSPEKALNSLKWVVAEMLRRYDLAKNVNARNFKEYNEKIEKNEKLPYIVVIVDELADLMMSWNKKEVEASIARIAQMARAVWIHLIIATQRPSVDVITWLIKANIPSRIAFTVASQIDSRTIIDKAWAEDLLWRWDMLYFPTWNMEPIRVQWVFVETQEVEEIVKQIKLTIDPDVLENMYDESIVNWSSKISWSIFEKFDASQKEDPEIIEKAIKIVREAKKWSTSLIQRKLWLWYARAAKVLDILEEMWIVWPANWSKPREVYD